MALSLPLVPLLPALMQSPLTDECPSVVPRPPAPSPIVMDMGIPPEDIADLRMPMFVEGPAPLPLPQSADDPDPAKDAAAAAAAAAAADVAATGR